jgi:FkbM family methyltransferase
MYPPMHFFDLPTGMRIVSARHGMFLVNLHDFYIGQALANFGEYSELELQAILHWMPKGRDVVEVGANMGSHSVALSRATALHGRKLLAIEPQPVIFQQLNANLALNHIRNAHTLPLACAQSAARLWYSPQDYQSQGNFGGVSLQSQYEAGMECVDALPLDELVAAHWNVGLLKIDVEGMESDVLLGAKRLIERCRPVIYLENDRPAQSQKLIELLWDLQYHLWFHLPPQFNPDNFAVRSDNPYPENLVSVNMICFPREVKNYPHEAWITDAKWHPLKSTHI